MVIQFRLLESLNFMLLRTCSWNGSAYPICVIIQSQLCLNHEQTALRPVKLERTGMETRKYQDKNIWREASCERSAAHKTMECLFGCLTNITVLGGSPASTSASLNMSARMTLYISYICKQETRFTSLLRRCYNTGMTESG